MSRSIEVPDDVYAALEAAASNAGVTLAEWLALRVNGQVTHECPQENIPYEVLLERFRAIVGSAHGEGEGEDLSTRHSEVFGEMLEAQHKAGRL
jgi:hypothetical protein